MGVIVSISGLLNDMLKQCVRCSQKKSTIAVHCYKHSYHNMFAHMCVLCFMSVCLDQKNTCCYKQCFINMPFRGCPWASLFIMGLLAGDYTCRLTLLLSFCAGTVVSRGGLRPSFHNGPACWGLHLSSETAFVTLCQCSSFNR